MSMRGMFVKFKRNWAWRKRHAQFIRRLMAQIEGVYVRCGEDALRDGLEKLYAEVAEEAKYCGIRQEGGFQSVLAISKTMRDSVKSSENDLLFAAAKGVLSSRYGNALVEFGGDAHKLEEHRLSLCQQEDMKYCTNDCKGRHNCQGHNFCDYCGKPMCGCDVGYIGPFAVCTPCREKIKSAFAPSGDSNTKEGKGNG